jgi:hypothetical protein
MSFRPKGRYFWDDICPRYSNPEYFSPGTVLVEVMGPSFQGIFVAFFAILAYMTMISGYAAH